MPPPSHDDRLLPVRRGWLLSHIERFLVRPARPHEMDAVSPVFTLQEGLEGKCGTDFGSSGQTSTLPVSLMSSNQARHRQV